MGLFNLVKRFLLFFIRIIGSIVGYIPVLVYQHIYSKYFTKATYRLIGQRANNGKQAKKVLDIGTATGNPLYSIIDKFQNAEVVGIDIDKNYIPACQKLFKDHKNVTIQELNFYDLETAFPGKKFDVIIFGSSFMLMPDQVKALQVAKNSLSLDGKIYFLLTLYDSKNTFNSFMEKIKPYLKYVSTVDFGKVTYRSWFNNFLNDHGLTINYSARCQGNLILKYFKFYIYQTVITQ